MTILESAARLRLSAAMREGSRAEHEAAESSVFMAELLSGRLNRRAYVDYLLRLRTVYEALEATVAAPRGDRLVDAVADERLRRLPAIEEDLAHWAPDHGPVDSPAARDYAHRLGEAEWGGAVVAHHYTRYLGDLSGGQAIGRILERTFDLDGAGVAFYDFAAVPKPKPYKDAYRARLDALALGADDVDRVVAEVQVAFALNQALFAELGRDIGRYRTPND